MNFFVHMFEGRWLWFGVFHFWCINTGAYSRVCLLLSNDTPAILASSKAPGVRAPAVSKENNALLATFDDGDLISIW